ncbi:MAG: efflux RND transporter periplasmic adaptor subunit [Treponema sp.]|jgi:multidrug efflux pump subunit AcrA (membrane-fusion protein)|nr:efflux RND transporter periplasmic adaptor subunit [Treponema sp.]
MKKINKKRFITVAVLLTAVLVFSGCKKPGGPGGPGGPVIPVFAVVSMEALQGSISDYLAFSGDIAAASSVDAYSDAAGKISRLYVSVGSRVSKGDPIAEVDPSRPGMDFVPSVVKAPVSGTIVALPAQLGMTISQAVPLARISGGSGLEIRLYVAERFISRISMGQNCEITLDAWPGEIFRGRISEISPVVDPSSRTMEARISVDNIGSRLKAGMFAKVKIITEQKSSVVKIPASAMLQRFGEEYVFTVEADAENDGIFVARKKIVVPGIHIDGILEIVRGLNTGDEVIIRGQSLLDDGARVNVVERSQPFSSN